MMKTPRCDVFGCLNYVPLLSDSVIVNVQGEHVVLDVCASHDEILKNDNVDISRTYRGDVEIRTKKEGNAE